MAVGIGDEVELDMGVLPISLVLFFGFTVKGVVEATTEAVAGEAEA